MYGLDKQCNKRESEIQTKTGAERGQEIQKRTRLTCVKNKTKKKQEHL